MSRFAEALANLWLAMRAAFFDRAALDAFKDDDRSVWRSFWALPVVVAMDLGASVLTRDVFADPAALDSRSTFAAGWVVVGWMLGLNIAAEFARVFGKSARFPRFVVAHNWAAAIQAGLFTVGMALLSVIGAGPSLLGYWIAIVGFWSLVFDWFIAKTALNIPGAAAALLMGVLLFTALFLNYFAASFAG